jgi:hypothetical protein
MQGAQDLVGNGSGLYFTVYNGAPTYNNGVFSISNGCTPTRVAGSVGSMDDYARISADSSGFYYFHQPIGPPYTQDIAGYPLPFFAVPGPAAEHAVASDGCSGIYWTTGVSDIWRAPKVASGAPPAYPFHVVGGAFAATTTTKTMEPVVDNNYVYWTDASGWIGRVPK